MNLIFNIENIPEAYKYEQLDSNVTYIIINNGDTIYNDFINFIENTKIKKYVYIKYNKDSFYYEVDRIEFLYMLLRNKAYEMFIVGYSINTYWEIFNNQDTSQHHFNEIVKEFWKRVFE